jgi:hypothetical protein
MPLKKLARLIRPIECRAQTVLPRPRRPLPPLMLSRRVRGAHPVEPRRDLQPRQQRLQPDVVIHNRLHLVFFSQPAQRAPPALDRDARI